MKVVKLEYENKLPTVVKCGSTVLGLQNRDYRFETFPLFDITEGEDLLDELAHIGPATIDVWVEQAEECLAVLNKVKELFNEQSR